MQCGRAAGQKLAGSTIRLGRGCMEEAECLGMVALEQSQRRIRARTAAESTCTRKSGGVLTSEVKQVSGVARILLRTHAVRLNSEVL